MAGTCSPWATEADLCSPCDDYGGLSVSAGDFLQAASDLLYEMSGGQFNGICSRTVRPCARRVVRGRNLGGAPPGWRRSWGECFCADACGCGSSGRVDLGAYPVVDVTEVRVNGVVLDPSRYRLDDRRTLVRLADADGTNPGWPTTQRLDLPTTEEGTWSVTIQWGREAPEAGVRAAAVLACEMALACDPENHSRCRLPKTATSVTREGVSIVLSPSDFLDRDGKTGIWEVDLFLRAYNPQRIRRPASVWHAGMARPAVETT